MDAGSPSRQTCATDRNFSIEDGDPFDLGDVFLSEPTNQIATNLFLSDRGIPFVNSPCATGGAAPNDPFFDAVSYRGGLDPNGEDWTAGWTHGDENLTPGTGRSQVSVSFVSSQCGFGTCIIDVAPNDPVWMRSDMTWGPDLEFILRADSGPAYMFVGDGTESGAATLTLLPGAEIRSEGPVALVVTQHSRIIAEGTRNSPITFTSNRSNPRPGDWGGVIIVGRARANCGTDCVDASGLWGFGGDNDQDNSGVLKYVRFHYVGDRIGGENQHNGLTLAGVGSGTVIDHVEVFAGPDDGIEFMGGTVSAKHLLLHDIGDDSIDWTYGWRGRLQHVVIKQPPLGNRGFEGDNSDFDNAATPLAAPTIANFTVIGNTGTNDAMTVRRGTQGRFYNGCMTVPEDHCLDVDGAETFEHLLTGDLRFENMTLACCN